MKRWLLRIAVFAAAAALSNVLTVAALPWLINAYVLHRIAGAAGGDNRAIHMPRPDAATRGVVRLSPDLLYSACVYDISKQPLHITAPAQASYVSVAGFGADTSNFFAVSNSDGRKNFDLVLVRQGSVAPAGPAQVITAPSARGLILFRSLIADDAELPKLREEFQSHQDCALLN